MSVASPSRPVRRDAPSSLQPNFPAHPAVTAPEGQAVVSTSAAPADAAVSPPVLEVSAPAVVASPADRVSPRNDLAYSTGDAASYSLMVGLGETYFSAFALAIGTGQTFAGLLATLPQLAGSLLQLLEQARVLHREHCLRREITQERDVLLRKQSDFLTADSQDTEHNIATDQRNRDRCTSAPEIHKCPDDRITVAVKL